MTTEEQALQLSFERLRHAWLEDRPAYEQRLDDLKRLRERLEARLDEMAKAISADFGNRSLHETLLGEASVVFAEIDDALHNLKRWMKPKRCKAGWKMWPAKAEIRYVPLGVVGIIAPWNYPVNLALAPLVAAIAAGNHVFLKPSEHTPRTAEFLQSMLADVFPEDRVTVALGDASLSAQFASLPFDHLFFTGSTAVGRKIMAAAAPNLTPVTLELGGKSPAIVSENANLKRAARAIATGKFFNAGQTCIAPDYVLIHHSKRDEFVNLLRAEMQARYGSASAEKDRTTIINDAQEARLSELLADAANRSEAVIELPASSEQPRSMAPALVLEPAADSTIMREEIFGPLLPIVSYRLLDDAIGFVLKLDRPLALYCFSDNTAEIEMMLSRIVAGGVCVNDTLYHFACSSLPFGGVGASGMGQYHGHDGFLTFSKAMPVLTKYAPAPSDLIKPPYTGLTDRLIRFIAR
ncbi:coniferyl aldehyde dehydrogenase [Brucella anthropi]|uniref:coniferyl aldehyde dehydrogenase n=1 Tax=Brucella anthropi TaxID=529 RepID=UPI00124DD831|nr:coniferyl aldehyde dehydrogenase [Brucella anthropi]KAB2790688.1 coniferyl aldehyde dehydrogenase [Brucella anthropi]QOD63022.1 coniferyl aldehyde dehydrogenase [Ochrobactrum sp. MT180101]